MTFDDLVIVSIYSTDSFTPDQEKDCEIAVPRIIISHFEYYKRPSFQDVECFVIDASSAVNSLRLVRVVIDPGKFLPALTLPMPDAFVWAHQFSELFQKLGLFAPRVEVKVMGLPVVMGYNLRPALVEA
jgi:hypothetical protein